MPSESNGGKPLALAAEWPGFNFRQTFDLKFLEPGPPMERWTGLSQERWTAEAGLLLSCLPHADVTAFERHLRESNAAAEGCSILLRLRHQRSGRLSYLLELRRGGGSEKGGAVYECQWIDVTNWYLDQQRLRHLAWKDNLSEFTRSFTHDFNNILAGVMSLSDFFLIQVDEQHPFHEGLTLIKKQFLHGASLLARLSSNYQGRPGTKTVHDLNALTRETLDLVRDVIPRRLNLMSELAEESLPIYVDAVEFRRNVIGLALNAAEAISGSGTVTVKTTATSCRVADSSFHGTRPAGAAACLTIHDTGRGIPGQVLSRIFDPNYTTKPPNHGSGLGLFLALSFLRHSGGGISVESVLGQGSVFQLWFPQADFTEADQALVAERDRVRQVLIAGPEDEMTVAIGALLARAGHRVVHSFFGTTRILGANDEKFDLLFIRSARINEEWTELIRVTRHYRAIPAIALQTEERDLIPRELAGFIALLLPWDLASEGVVEGLGQLLEPDVNKA